MPTLPAELWSNILWYLWAERHDDYWPNKLRSTFQALVHSSRLLYNAGMPLLYKQCLLKNETCTRKCLSTLLKNDLAASSVRHLTLSINFPDTDEDEDELLLEHILSKVLERLRNLVSFHLIPHASNNYWPPEPESEERSEYLTTSILASPQRFPFRLKIFATTLSFTPHLSQFFESQDSIEHLQLFSPHAPDILSDSESDEAIPTLPSRLQSFALTYCAEWDDLVDSAHFWLYSCSTVRHIVLSLELTGSYVDDDEDISRLVEIPLFSNLTALTVRGEWERGLESFLERFVPCIPNLTYMSISAQETHGLDLMIGATSIFNSLPKLDTVIYDMVIEEDELKAWLLEDVDLPTSIQIYARFPCESPLRVRDSQNIRISYDQDSAKWRYALLPTGLVEFPVPGICFDNATRYDPEKVLNAAFHMW